MRCNFAFYNILAGKQGPRSIKMKSNNDNIVVVVKGGKIWKILVERNSYR